MLDFKNELIGIKKEGYTPAIYISFKFDFLEINNFILTNEDVNRKIPEAVLNSLLAKIKDALYKVFSETYILKLSESDAVVFRMVLVDMLALGYLNKDEIDLIVEKLDLLIEWCIERGT